MEKPNFRISFYHDKRRIKDDGTYSIKLYVFDTFQKKKKLYNTIFSFTEKEFKDIWQTLKPRNEDKQIRLQLQALENKANEVANKLTVFNFDDFERLMYGSTGTKLNINYYFDKIIDKYLKKESISTAFNYKNALNCLLRFHKAENIDFRQVTKEYLENFEKFCINDENKSITTVSMYTRCLRAVFNNAIDDNVISKDIYPFGDKKYQIKTPKNIKKSLTAEQLRILFEGTPSTPEQEKAKDFWFFSFFCNGMNIKDILNLKCKNVEGDKITFVRAKTEKTTKEQKSIIVYLNDYTKKVIDKYGNIKGNQNDFVFNILKHSQTAILQLKRKNAFIRYVTQHFLKYAQNLGINEQISTYYARHSYATISIRNGASMEFIGEALGHTDIKTTINYFKGFDDDKKREHSNKTFNFFINKTT